MKSRVRLSLLAAIGSAAMVAMACSSAQTPAAPTGQPANTPPPPTSTASQASARYRVTFQSTWTERSHPIDFPSSAHFSPLVGGTHSDAARFWGEGQLASTGIKDMAERGRTSPIDQEVEAAIAAGTAERVFIGGAIGTTPGSVSLEFEASQTHPLVTLVSMVAPSPDWFVGVSGLPLFENGRWVDERRIDLVPWDAGTDSGSTFASPDLITAPAQPVSRIVTAPLSPGGRVAPLGTFTFTRLSPAS